MMSEKPEEVVGFVVVNVTQVPFGALSNPGEFCVMPGEEPHTYGTLDAAVETIANLAEEFEHTPDTTRVYALVPVDSDAVWKSFSAEMRRRLEDSAND